MTAAVKTEDTARATAHPVKINNRAEDTPVTKDTTTNILRGTRNSEDNCVEVKNWRQKY